MNSGQAPRSGGLQTADECRRAVWKAPLLGLLTNLFLLATSPCLADPVLIGSKKFTESYVLAEIAKRVVGKTGTPVEHREGMGGTIIVWQALRGDQISAYPEYTGTLAEEILKVPPSTSANELREQL